MGILKYQVSIVETDRSFTVCEEKNLLDSMIARCGDLAPKGCHSGGCGVCKIKILSGKFITLKMNRKHISLDEENNNVVLACRVFPRSDMEIEVLSKPRSKEKEKLYQFGS